MNADSTRMIREVLAQYGLVKDIPESVLQEKRLKVLHNAQRNAYQLVTVQEYQDRVQNCHKIMTKYKDYLFADDLSRMERLIDSIEMLTEKEIAAIGGRAKRLVEAGIPPIFQRVLYHPSFLEFTDPSTRAQHTYTLFPSVDFVIQFATGAYERRRAAISAQQRAAGLESKRDRRIPIRPTTAKDIVDFRRLAFTREGRINPLLVRETIAYVQEHFRFSSLNRRNEHLESDHRLFLFLKEQLQHLPCEPMVYETWDENLDTVAQPRWYLKFTPEETAKIARAYFDMPTSLTTKREQGVLSRMALLFPNLAQQQRSNDEEQQATRDEAILRAAVAEAQRTGNFKVVPRRVFLDRPWCTWAIPAVEAYLRDTCQRLQREKPEVLLTSMTQLLPEFPRYLLRIPRLGDIISTVQLEIVETMDDSTFIATFASDASRERYKLLVWSATNRKNSAVAGVLRRTLKARYQHLAGD